MRPLRVSLMVLAVVALALPALAGPILLPDPGAGVLGGVRGTTTYPTLGEDTGFFTMVPCESQITGDLPGVWCQTYNVPLEDYEEGGTGFVGVFNIDLIFADSAGNVFPQSSLFVSSFSAFMALTTIGPNLGGQIRLSDSGGFLECEEEEEYEYYGGYGDYESEPCSQITAILHNEFLEDPQVSVPQFNTPEPGTMFLLAMGVAAAAARGYRRRAKR